MPSRGELLRAGFDADAYVAHDLDWYDGSIRGMDAEIGRLIERLRALGLAERTLVVFTGDHGEEFLEHGRTFHGQTTYGELADVPLILWGPGRVPKGVVVEETVQVLDLMPTLLEMSRLSVPEGIQGRSLLPLLQGSAVGTGAPPGWRERPAITEKAATSEDVGAPPPRDTESVAIVAGGFKLIHNVRRQGGRPEYELYDHRKDPLDRTDVAAQHPEDVRRLARELDAWRRKALAARLKPDSAASGQFSREELARLRSLGYIQ